MLAVTRIISLVGTNGFFRTVLGSSRNGLGDAPVQRVLSNDLWTEVRKQARASNTRIGGIAYVTRDLILDVLNAHAAQLPQRD